MRALHRQDLETRVELLPLIDVIFLLLTFFIYSQITMVRAEIMPIELMPLMTDTQAEPAKIAAITIDAAGGLYLNRQPITPGQLDKRLSQIAQEQEQPKLFLAVEEVAPVESDGGPGTVVVDRGPILIRLIDQVRAASIEDFVIGGQSRRSSHRPATYDSTQ